MRLGGKEGGNSRGEVAWREEAGREELGRGWRYYRLIIGCLNKLTKGERGVFVLYYLLNKVVLYVKVSESWQSSFGRRCCRSLARERERVCGLAGM